MTRRSLWLLGLACAATVAGASAGAFFSSGGAKQRPTNVEVRLLSQSCFQGEVEPCG
ncbi:MAG: hypothetical protein FJY75_03315 [Candidatus Eisenbacteria bacterium]|uniref:Uncharacterized protein n=1 Tax=Eiseniibacteriota bacterium TaxID=2212470 RepID=A0A938BQG9_UNCEI|nr:hypothetical protein [Candidatus Eisenbacteria bacterium]